MTANAGSTLGARAGGQGARLGAEPACRHAHAGVLRRRRRRAAHVGGGHRPTPASPPRSVACPTSSSTRSGTPVPGSTSIGPIDPETAVVFGGGPGWAAALEAALLLKEVARVPAEGVETREGATSAMMALAARGARAEPARRRRRRSAARGGRGDLRGSGCDGAPRARRRDDRPQARGGLDVPRRRRAGCPHRPRARPRRRPARVDRRVLPGRETSEMSLGLGVIGCGSVFAGPYRAMIERLRAEGRVHVSAVYDVDDAKRRGAAAHYDVEPGAARARRGDRRSRRRRRPRADEHERARPARAGRARGGQARARREADGDVARGGGRAPRAGGDVARPARLRAAHPPEPDLPRGARCRARRPRRRAPHRPRALRLGRARGGASGSTRRAAGRCSTSASTTSRASAPCSGPRGA